jgi:3-phenylpropionate/trans-cinnamate dioxygenase ferredoxin subunit
MAPEFIEIARAGDIPPGETRFFKVNERYIILANVDGTFYALSGICSHKKLPMDGAEVEGHVVICPWHFTHFDVRTGEQVKWAYGGPLATFPVKCEGDAVLVCV